MGNYYSLDKKFAWSFSGFIIGIVSLILALYIFYYTLNQNEFDLKLIINQEMNLIELKENLSGLKIIYNDNDILSSDKEIRIITFTLQNDGKDILQSFYDNTEPYGILFNKSEILNYILLNTNSDYLKKNLLNNTNPEMNSKSVNRSLLLLNKVIIEKNKYATIKVFLLQSKGVGKIPFTILGKIAGIDKIPIEYASEEKSDDKFNNLNFSNVLKLIGIIYTSLIIFMLILIIPISYRDSRKKKKVLKSFKLANPLLSDKQASLIKELNDHPRYLKIASSILDNDKVISISELLKDYEKKVYNPIYRLFPSMIPLDIILPKDIFIIDDRIITLNPDNTDLVKKFIDYTKNSE